MVVTNERLTNILVLLSFLDYLAVSMVAPHIGLRIRELGASQFMIGVISSSYGAVQLFSCTLHGVTCDKYGRRLTLLLCLLLITLSYLALSVSLSFISILAIRSVLGLVKHTQSSLKVIGGDINTGSARSMFISKMNSASGLAFMIGPFITAYFFEVQTSFMYGCWLCSCIFVGTIIITYFFVDETLPEQCKPEGGGPVNQHLSIIQRFKKYSNLRDIFIYRFCAAGSVIILRYFTPLYTQHYFGFNARHASYMTSFIGFSGIVCSSLAGYVAWLVPDKYRLTRYLSLLLVLSIAATLLSASMAALLATQFLLSFATQNLRIMVDSLILSAASDTDRGEVFGLGASIIGLCRVGGPVVAGVLAEAHMVLPLVCSLLLATLGSGVLFWNGRKVKQG